MTVADFEKRASYQGGYDRIINEWKVIDIHMIPDVLLVGTEVDFYCSNGKIVYLLRIRIKDQKQVDKLMFVAADKRCPTIYLVAEIDADFIDDNLIGELLNKFHSGKYDH